MKSLGGTYQKRFLVLCAGLTILSILSYKLSFSKTVEAMKVNTQLEEKVGRISGLDNELLKYKQMTAGLVGEHSGSGVGSFDFNQGLLDKVGRFCEDKKLVLVEYAEPLRGEEKGYTIETGMITVEGEFKPLLELLHRLQNEFKLGSVVAADFEKEQNYRRNREELFVKIYVQKISKNEDT